MDLLLSLGIVTAAVFVLIQAGKRVVRTLGSIARFAGVSEYVLSFILIAFATSLPELSVGINAALMGIPELSFGDIMGTNIVNFTLILGVIAIVGGTIKLRDYEHYKSNRLFEFIIVMAPLLLLLDGTLSRVDGVILLVLFAWNLMRLLDIDDRILGRKVLRPHLALHVYATVTTWRELWRDLAELLVAIGFLLGATMAIVLTVDNLSQMIGVSQALIGVLVVAIATSLPELTIGIRSAYRKRGGIALGDLFGAAAINSSLTLGIVALIHPIVLTDMSTLWIGIAFTALVFLLTFYFLHTKSSLSRSEGYMLVAVYVLFAGAQIASHVLW